jgi:hypothetical protein
MNFEDCRNGEKRAANLEAPAITDDMKCRHSERSEESPREAPGSFAAASTIVPRFMRGCQPRRRTCGAERFARGLLGKLGVTVVWVTVVQTFHITTPARRGGA